MVTGKDTGTVGDFFESYARILGLMLLGYILIMLFSTPSMIIAKSVTTIGTELSYDTGNELAVRTKIDFGSNAHMQAFTPKIGDWIWIGKEYADDSLKETLGADVLLLRRYSQPGKILDLLLMQSNNRSSFHPPIVCYPALGYTIEEEGREFITLQNASWAAERWLQTHESVGAPTIAVKKLVVVKNAETGEIEERQVVLYFYVKGNVLANDTVTMVRVSGCAPVSEPYDSLLNREKEFMAETFPYLFEMSEREPRVFNLLAFGSRRAKVALLLLLLAPLLVIFYPELKATKRRWTASKRQE